MSTPVFQRIRRNLLGSLGLTLVVYAVTTVANLVLLRWFGQQGGLELIGLWTVLITVMSVVLLTDYGFRDALTRLVAVEGLDTPLCIVLRLCGAAGGAGILASTLALTWAGLVPTQAGYVWGGLSAALAGVLQVASGWLVSLRLGRHEQHWWYLKILTRVVAQTAAAPALMLGTDMDWILALGLALLVGALAETGLALWATRHDLAAASMRASRAIPVRTVIAVTRGFGPANVLQRLQEPVIRTLLVRLGGLDVLGAFTVSWKLPQTAGTAVSEGLRPLLPGLSDLLRAGEADKAAQLLGQSLFFQMVLSVPTSLFLCLYSAPIFQVWLGLSDPGLVHVTWVLISGYALKNLTVPFFWTLQAYGFASTIAWLTAVNIAVIVAVCVPALLFMEDAILTCAFGLVLSQFAFSLLAHTICQRRLGIVSASYRYIPWGRVFALNIPAFSYNLALSSYWDPALGQIRLLIFAVVGSATLYGLTWGIILMLRRR